MTSPPGPGFRSRRAIALIASLAVLSAAVLASFLLRERARSTSEAAPSSTPSTPVSDEAPASATARCAAEKEGPLRQDTQFTANDAARTTVRYSISLPDDYYSACKEYPVLYALHGKTGNNVAFLDDALSMRKAMAAGVLDQAIIVTPDSYSTGRWENRETGPAEDNFIKYLIPHIEQDYRVKPGPSYRLLTGFSMGGHGAMRFGLKYPDMFAAVWSVDGAMADSASYLPFVEGRSSADFHIISVGGQLNGARVQALVDALKAQGIDIPYVYQDREHKFVAFVEEDEKAGWVAMKYLQDNLGRSM
ncbi:MAG: alpha/beta hydrolase-fold protein [Kineosporiaceae bacterium]